MSTPPPEQPTETPVDPWATPAAPPPPGQTGAITTPPGYPPVPYGAAYPPNLSSVGKRFGASLLDGLLLIVTFGIGWIIWDLIVWKDGQSPAKQLLHMRIINGETWQPIDWGKSFLRNFVCYGLIGLIPLAGPIYRLVGACFVFNDDRRALWDRMVNTYVVNDN
jgi:uncharacterized RDD family membrane protein YckC